MSLRRMSRRSSGSRRLGRRRARSYPHPDGRGPQSGAKPRSAHGPETEIDRGATERGPPPTRRRCHARRTGAQLRRRQEHNFTTRIMTVNPQIELVRLAVAIMMILPSYRFPPILLGKHSERFRSTVCRAFQNRQQLCGLVEARIRPRSDVGNIQLGAP